MPGLVSGGVAGVEWRSAPERQQPGVTTSDRPYPSHEKRLVITNREVPEDLAVHTHCSLDQERRTGGPETPIDRGEFVDGVTGLLAEEAGKVDLILAQEMEAHAWGACGNAVGVIHLRNADEEVRWVDAALGHEPGEAATHLGLG